MNSPFRFGTVVTGEQFTNREDETGRLHSNFRNLRNSVVISPRRIGKTSLITHAVTKFLENEVDKHVRFCFVDMYKVRDEEDFCDLFVTSTLS